MIQLFEPFGHRTKIQKRVLIVFWTVVLFLAWQFWPGTYMPRPAGTWAALEWLYGRGLIVEIWVSTWVIIRSGFMIAFPIGCVLSYLYTIPFFRPLVVMIASCRNASMNALIAVFLMMSLDGDRLKVITMSFVLLVYFVSSVTSILDSLPQDEIDHAIAMRMSSWQTLWHRVVRGRFYDIATSFVPCIAMGWAMLSFVEGAARGLGGLGDLMLQNDKINSYDGILALTFVAVAFGLGISLVLQGLLRWMSPYVVQKSVK